MFRCNECGAEINLSNQQIGDIIECEICGIDLEIAHNRLISHQIGLSEE